MDKLKAAKNKINQKNLIKIYFDRKIFGRPCKVHDSIDLDVSLLIFLDTHEKILK